ncbi:hypothetical protein [Streptomyces sp. CC219B]|uniref:hypothetical protein n=1 Tax=Streptomyces sp. CC219B TaxID=3044574 RepID=UPI0024A9C711|nr:hypothetical protein [Streptomyces sp. CC219B]
MKPFPKIAALVVVVTAIVSACTNDSAGKDEPETSSRSVCNSFAKAPEAAAALREATGTDDFLESRSEPDETLRLLREADGKLEHGELSGSPYCRLQSAEDESQVLTISFREALAVNKSDAEDEKHFIFYQTGESAYSSEYTSTIYFKCRMKNPSKEIIIHGDLERESKVDVSAQRLTADNILLLNAAAQKVSTELDCADPNLAAGMPKATSER